MKTLDDIYGYVYEDQVNWCKEDIAEKNTENSEVSVSVFLHENTPPCNKKAVSLAGL